MPGEPGVPGQDGDPVGYSLSPSIFLHSFFLFFITSRPPGSPRRSRSCWSYWCPCELNSIITNKDGKKVGRISSFFNNYNHLFDLPEMYPGVKTPWLAFPLVIKNNKLFKRKELQIHFEKNNIQTRTIFTGNILKQPVMKNKIYKYFKDCNHVANNVMKNGILLGCHHGMSISDVNTICKIFLKFLNK